MTELTTIDNLDVTQLSKKKLLDYFALTISQEQPVLDTFNIVKQNWRVMVNNSESSKYEEINAMIYTLSDKSLEEISDIRDTFIKNDIEKLNEVKKEIHQYQEKQKIQEAEYREQRKNLNIDSLAKHLDYKNTSEFEKRFIGEAQTKSPVGMGCLSTVIAIAVGIIFYNYPPFELVDVSAGHGQRAVLFIGICMILSYFLLPVIYKLSKKMAWSSKISQNNNITNFLKKLPLELTQGSYGIKNGKPSHTSHFHGTTYDYPNSLDYSVTLNVEEYNNYLERAKILEEHISIWKNKGEEFLISVKNYGSELQKISILKKTNTRLGEAIPKQWTKNSREGIIETSLIFSNLLSAGRADTWKEAANLVIEDKFKQSILKELVSTRQAMIDTMIKTGEIIRESISEEIYQMANDVSSSIEAEGIRNQLAMNNVNSSLDRVEVIGSAIFIENLLR